MKRGKLEQMGTYMHRGAFQAALLPRFISGCRRYGFIGVTTLWFSAVIVTRPLLARRVAVTRGGTRTVSADARPSSTFPTTHPRATLDRLQPPSGLLFARTATVTLSSGPLKLNRTPFRLPMSFFTRREVRSALSWILRRSCGERRFPFRIAVYFYSSRSYAGISGICEDIK